MGGQFSSNYVSLQGQLRKTKDGADENPIFFNGRVRNNLVVKKALKPSPLGPFGSCCAPSPDLDTGLSDPTGVEELYSLLPANPDLLHRQAMQDITDAGLVLYQRAGWVDALNMQDAVKGKEIKSYIEKVLDDDMKTVLTNMITAQVASGVWNDGDLTMTEAWASNGFKTQQDVKDRGQYYLQAMGDKTCLAGEAAFSKLYKHVKSYLIGQMTPGLSSFIEGKDGKTPERWATELFYHAVNVDHIDYLFTSDTSDASLKTQHLSKIHDIMGALTANSEETYQKLPETLMQVVSLTAIDKCREFVASLPLADIQDLISKQVELFWQKAGDDTVNADVRDALKDTFKALGATTDVSATLDFQHKLGQFFVDTRDELDATSRIETWNDDFVSKDYSTRDEKDLNRIKNFSTFLMLSSFASVANFALRTKRTQAWSDDGVDRTTLTNFGVSMLMAVMQSRAEGQSNQRKAASARDSVPGYFAVQYANQVFDPYDVNAEAAEEIVNIYYPYGEDSYDRMYLDAMQERIGGVFEGAGGAVPVGEGVQEAQYYQPGPAEADDGSGCLNWVMGKAARKCLGVTLGIAQCVWSIVEFINDKDKTNTETILSDQNVVFSSCAAICNVADIAVFSFSSGDLAISGIGAALGPIGLFFIACAVVVEFVYHILRGQKTTPQQDYVNQVAPVLNKVNKPSEDWLRDHQIPN
jgi:hypothetical protein